MLERIFPVKKPIIGMVHLQDKGDEDKLSEQAAKDIERLERGGVDGLLFENWGGEYRNRYLSLEERERLIRAIKKLSEIISLPFGVNILPLDYEASFDIAKESGARFVQVDTFVDKVITDYENRFVIDVDPQEVIDYRWASALEDFALFVNIQTKHYQTIPPNKKLETSALQAVQNGADVLVVTGEATGKRTPLEKIVRVKKVCPNTPVVIGSGLNEGNVGELLPYADGAIVGTSLKYYGVTENPVEQERVEKLMDAVYQIRGRLN